MESAMPLIKIKRGIKRGKNPYKAPTPEQLKSPNFEAVWQTIKKWDINVPDTKGHYMGPSGASGNLVAAILQSLVDIGSL